MTDELNLYIGACEKKKVSPCRFQSVLPELIQFLLWLAGSFFFGDEVGEVILGDSDRKVTGFQVVISGWGGERSLKLYFWLWLTECPPKH